jgi:hypothetical protein
MAGHGEKLTRKQDAAIAALLVEPTVEGAAAAAGLAGNTLKSWLRKPSFQAAYAKARQQVLERAVARLLALLTRAADTLERNLTCGKPSAENRAAGLIFAQAIRGVETLDLVRRIAELEIRLSEQEKDDDSNADEEGGEVGTGGPPAAGGGGAAAAPAAPGPEPNPDRGGHDSGPVAGEPSPLFPATGADAVRPAGG